MSTHGTALVTGAHGVIGVRLVEHLAQEGWDVVGVSRRGGRPGGRVRHVAADLLDPAATRSAFAGAGLDAVTHVFHAAYTERPTWAGLVGPNLALLANAVEGVERVAPRLEHVQLMQGYKVYGAHLGPFETPAREDDPGHLPPEFNLEQQSWLTARADAGGWAWTALRPSVVVGTALGNPMNLLLALAVHAAMCAELGVPMRFPGRPGAYDSLLELTDAGLLARASVWAATEPAAANQAFNIANGDLLRWRRLWPRLADLFGVETAAPLPMSWADVMADKEPLWDRIVSRHGLVPTPFAQVSSWPFADAVFAWDYDFFADTTKARRLGFTDFVDTEAMFAHHLHTLRARRIIPP